MQRTDLTSAVPTFIEMATAHFNALLRVPQMEAVASTTATGEWTALPADFLQIRAIESGDKRLDYVTPEEFALRVAGMDRPPLPVYTIADMSFRMYPTPSDLPIEILYYARIPAFAAPTSTNWLLTEHPLAYLSASLMFGFDYLHDDARAAKWEQRTAQHIAQIQRSGRQLAEGAATMTVKVA